METNWELWNQALAEIFESPRFLEIMKRVELEYAQPFCFPEFPDIFRAFRLMSPDNIKVVILGQDPYHGRGEAHGLSFSVPMGTKLPPSLKNIFKELRSDLGETRILSDLSDWAAQGVLLLNTHLTVRENRPLSHRNLGWEWFTDHVITCIANRSPETIFVFWGNEAKKKKTLLLGANNPVIESSHPSPLGAHKGFLGSKPFSQINLILRRQGKSPIIWA